MQLSEAYFVRSTDYSTRTRDCQHVCAYYDDLGTDYILRQASRNAPLRHATAEAQYCLLPLPSQTTDLHLARDTRRPLILHAPTPTRRRDILTIGRPPAWLEDHPEVCMAVPLGTARTFCWIWTTTNPSTTMDNGRP